MATLTIKRDRGYADAGRAYRILLDGRDIGGLSQGDELCRDISAGQHVLEARIDWCGSQPLRLEVDSDQFVVVRSALRGWRMLLVLFYILFFRRHYLTMELQSAT